MNKTELVDAMAADAGITKAQAKAALDSFTENVSKALAKKTKSSTCRFRNFFYF